MYTLTTYLGWEHPTLYHEISQVKTAEASCETGSTLAGPALFSTTSAVTAGEGQAKARQQAFAETAAQAS